MTSSNSLNTTISLSQTLQNFTGEYIDHYKTIHGGLPQIEHDQQWPSPCEQFENTEAGQTNLYVAWQPTLITDPSVNFDNVESALTLTLHADIKSYFSTLYSESLDAQFTEGKLSLLFAWSKEDFARLQENIIGHILMKQRLKQAETIFFAVTDEEDTIISVDNETGAVWVERVGREPHKKLTNSLSEFISQLSPQV